MNGAHDMGGLHGFGPVTVEPDEPVFHSDWERRVFALNVAMGLTGEWSIDEARFARESLPPAEYLSKTYYEIWLAGLESLLTQHGLVGVDEIDAGRMSQPAKPVQRILSAADAAPALNVGGRTTREPPRPPRFRAGDRVRAKNMHPESHTRLPRYVRGRTGTVTVVHGCHVFPDARANGRGEDPQWLYTVCFDATELWGDDADPTVAVSVDAFEPYLDVAP